MSPDHDWGLDPRFILPLQLYYRASVDRRAGMNGVLIGTLTPSDMRVVMDLYAEHMPTSADRQRMYEMMQVLDEVATRERSKKEAAMAEEAAAAARAGSQP